MTIPWFLQRTASAGGITLQAVDFAYWESQTDPAGADGAAVSIAEPVDPDYYWLVQRIVVQADGATIPECDVYSASPTPTPNALTLRDHTRFGSVQVAEYPSGLLVLPNTALIVRWSGMSTGARGVVSAQYVLVQRVMLAAA